MTFESLQTPNPSHECPFCSPAAHVVLPQLVPGAYLAQAPLPSQEPLRPQLAAPSSAHSPSGSEAAATLPQAPFVPAPFLAALHAWHVPAHGESQHTPSTQLPLTHCWLPVQAAPLS